MLHFYFQLNFINTTIPFKIVSYVFLPSKFIVKNIGIYVYQQIMLNFNNKKQKDPPTTQFHRSLFEQHIQYEQISKAKQETPTQCLLLISQMEATDKTIQQYQNGLEQIQVAPWVNMPFRIKKDKNESKSKTSTLITSCDDYRNAHKQKGEKQNRVSFTKKESRKHIRLIHKNTDSITNIQSAIARYSHRNEQAQSVSNQFSNKNLKHNIIHLKTNNSSHQVTKVSSVQKNPCKGRQLSQNKNQKYNNENENDGELTGFELSRFGQNLKGMKSFMNSTGYKNSNNRSILRQNTAIVNQAKAVSLFSYADHQHCFENTNKESVDNLQSQEKQSLIMKKNEQTAKQLSIFRKAEFQNILTDAQKRTSEYHKIKTKILESIKKESVIRQGMKVDINKSKKMLGRYFKQIQQKKPKNKMKTHLNLSSNIQKTDGSDSGLQYANPLTKHLYDKYKLLLSKGK